MSYTALKSFGSPFPQIALKADKVPESEWDQRGKYLMWDRRHDVKTDDPRFTAGLTADAYHAHYPYHQPILAGPDGTVLTSNRHDQPTAVIGEYGTGRVAILGSYLGRRRPPDGDEARLFENIVRYLSP